MSRRFRNLRGGEVYGKALNEIVTLMELGNEPRKDFKVSDIFGDAFLSWYQQTGHREYGDDMSASDIANEERERYERFLDDVQRKIPGIHATDLIKPSHFFYKIRKVVKPHIRESRIASTVSSAYTRELHHG